MKTNIRTIAFYLPQYYPTPENDEWWQKGFTEWINVGRAKPLFKGHYQPKVPTDLGYYDLRVPEVRENQAELAREAGIEGFCYWHYWFNGRRLLDRVFSEVVVTGKPDYPFCLCWANHSWYRKNWDPTKPNVLLIEQTYPGVEDYTNHFNTLLPAFKDKRYIKVDGKPVFGIYKPLDVPTFQLFKETWDKLAKENGLPGIYFFGFTFEESQVDDIKSLGMDSVVFDYMLSTYREKENTFFKKVRRKIREHQGLANVFPYKEYIELLLKQFYDDDKVKPCIIPNYDHSPRSGNKFVIIHDSNPADWGKLCNKVVEKLGERAGNDNFLFIKAWNEWGEGNYMEPDIKYGKGYIEELKKALTL